MVKGHSFSHVAGAAAAVQNGESDHEKSESEEESESEGGEVDKARLRMYERSKLRWYYAIVECDSVTTARHIYQECDGMEFERSACKFDLR